MDLKKYFTNEEIENFCWLTQLLLPDYENRENLDDGFGVRDYNDVKHWRNVDENFSLLGKKTILILPGSGTNSAKQANGMCKIAENMLPHNQKDKWQICSMHYENSCMAEIPTVIRATELLDNYLIPLFTTKDNDGDLHKIDAKDAANNMRNIVIFTHCYGGYIEKEIERKMAELMINIGYTDKERDNIMKQMFVVQHNNIDEELGQNKMSATHLLRISAADEETIISDMLYGSFRHYTLKHKIDDASVAYLKASENERVLWTNRITKEGTCEHNGGYWVEKIHKSEAGLKEEALFQLIFHEVTSSDYPIENMEQILKKAAERSPENKKILTECLQSGKDFNSGFDQYKEKFVDDFAKLKTKVDNNSLTRTDILMADKDVCFVEDSNGRFLMDDLLENKDYDLASALMKKMAPAMPEKNTFGGCLDSKNKNDAAEAIHRWAQLTINDNQVDLFKQFADYSAEIWKLDYTQTDAKTLEEVVPLVFNKESYENCQDISRKDNYTKNIVAIYSATEKISQSRDTSKTQEYLENLLFKENIDIRRDTVINSAAQLGAIRLKRIAQNKWQQTNCGNVAKASGDGCTIR